MKHPRLNLCRNGGALFAESAAENANLRQARREARNRRLGKLILVPLALLVAAWFARQMGAEAF
jgi:hypothetical protein